MAVIDLVKGCVVIAAVADTVLVRDFVYELVTVTDGVEIRVVGIGDAVAVHAPDCVRDVDLVYDPLAVTDHVAIPVVGIGDAVNDLAGEGVYERDLL